MKVSSLVPETYLPTSRNAEKVDNSGVSCATRQV
nr:MAG TPA: hypothetical protein [Caudoviricetes sp.]